MSITQELAADIARELREDPTRWTTGESARTSSGHVCSAIDPAAVCWCLYGHLIKRDVDPYNNFIAAPFYHAAGLDWLESRSRIDRGYAYINDTRTVEQIIEICDKVASRAPGSRPSSADT